MRLGEGKGGEEWKGSRVGGKGREVRREKLGGGGGEDGVKVRGGCVCVCVCVKGEG